MKKGGAITIPTITAMIMAIGISVNARDFIRGVLIGSDFGDYTLIIAPIAMLFSVFKYSSRFLKPVL